MARRFFCPVVLYWEHPKLMSSTQLNAEQSDAVRKHMRYDVDDTTYYLEVLFEMYGFYVSAYYVCTHMFVL